MRQRSSYPKSFKAQVVQECLQPGASISSVAISHGINANVIRKWLPLYRDQPPATLPAFVPVKVAPTRQAESSVIIELPVGEQTITVKWPSSDPEGCVRFVRGLAS
ncbi:IS66-like element accessory protein TnpA [Pseudomonas azotoformans]|uniref:IS66-like element accessory protein TnpA n=1 Tax=Pseudomonas azotoformans TaxID=47878 RepID=UPI00087C1304|nr:transposase [Pseudomonas azotoformans]SDO02430.1 Transposase [Pseudomonas azotoformans]